MYIIIIVGFCNHLLTCRLIVAQVPNHTLDVAVFPGTFSPDTAIIEN